MEEIKKINIKEFREKGYLQEINRLFLHPLGLALAVKINDDSTEELDCIWDYREDEEGIYYDLENADDERIKKFSDNSKIIATEFENRLPKRKEKLDFEIEPIPYVD